MQPNRLPRGGRIDRSKPLNFTFNGKPHQGFQGDTLASALLANGRRLVARSFKYGRPRGIVGHGAEEPNAIVQLGKGAHTVPNSRATQVELHEGLAAASVTGWPSLQFDLLGAFSALGKLTPPGFYYKTFMRPRKWWMTYERCIRKAAGLGRAPEAADPDIYDKLNLHCDLAVIGGGPAGLAAALEAARSGARVILADEQNEFGGSLLWTKQQINAQPASQWIAQVVAELRACSKATLLPRATAIGYYDHNFLAILERRTDHLGCLSGDGARRRDWRIRQGGASDHLRANAQVARQRLHRVRAKQVVLATGALERPLVFAHNDLPGVMLASSVCAFINRYAVRPGRRLLLCTTNDNAYQAALDWRESGGEVAAVLDVREQPGGELVAAARDQGIEVISGHGIIEALGRRRVRGALAAPLNPAGDGLIGPAQPLPCDLIASSGGWSPVIHLSSHRGAKPQWSDALAGFLPAPSSPQAQSAGAANGVYGLLGCLRQGAEAGAKAAQLAGVGNGRCSTAFSVPDEPAEGPSKALFLVPHTKASSRAPKQFVDLQLDVTAADIALAAREGYESVEHLKRYTALGFGTEQGKLGNINGLAILAEALGQGIAETGTTIFRPPYTPATFGALAGRESGTLFDPVRRTAMHRWHAQRGAVWENVGQWQRPRYYPKPGETMQQAVNRECLAVRRGVGMMDASTLGKIDIQGPDAAEFITRIHTNSYLKLPPGRCRYGLMLHEDGVIFDDGVTSCLGPNHYLMFTTTGGAAAVLDWLELWRQTEWPQLRAHCTSVTDHWATATVSGPKARLVVQKLCGDIDLSRDAFRFMDWREGTVAGVKARVFRISFTGELSFEVHVPAHFGRCIWEALMEAGQEFGITPYGTEAMHLLRAEKGFIIVGQDTDGATTPGDMNMDWIVNNKKHFSFIGKRSLTRSDCLRKDRKQLVGLRPQPANLVLPEGAQIVNNPDEPLPMAMQGHVTSAYYSANLGYAFALAVVKGGLQRMGETVYCPLADGQIVPAQITPSAFYDPQGRRQNV